MTFSRGLIGHWAAVCVMCSRLLYFGAGSPRGLILKSPHLPQGTGLRSHFTLHAHVINLARSTWLMM